MHSAIDPTAFAADFAAMSTHGATPGGGVDRQAATPEDGQTRSWFAELMSAAGVPTYFDAIGNQYAPIELVPGADYVFVGSHLDSQPLAGRFDGAYGVLAGAHAALAVRAAAEEGKIQPRFNLVVVNWFNEEGSRFAPSMMGSSVACGTLELSEALQAQDLRGVTVAEAFESLGWDLSGSLPPAHAYLEIHVEQGKELERAGTSIGLVTSTWGAKKFQVKARGEQGHTGSTLMADRHDALFGAAIVIAEVERMTREFAPGTLQASVSQLTLEPNSPVTIAREVVFNVDLRSFDAAVLDEAHAKLEAITARAAQEARIVFDCNLTHAWGRLEYPPAGVEVARRVAQELGLSHQEIMTVAGHDSTNYKDVVPTIMLFVPSHQGISHNEAEFTSMKDCIAGVRMLTGCVEEVVTGAFA